MIADVDLKKVKLAGKALAEFAISFIKTLEKAGFSRQEAITLFVGQMELIHKICLGEGGEGR